MSDRIIRPDDSWKKESLELEIEAELRARFKFQCSINWDCVLGHGGSIAGSDWIPEFVPTAKG